MLNMEENSTFSGRKCNQSNNGLNYATGWHLNQMKFDLHV